MPEAIYDWSSTTTDLEEGFGDFVRMLVPWETGDDDDSSRVFKPTKPTAMSIEGSVAERGIAFKDNLEEFVLAPLLREGEKGKGKLLAILEKLQDMLLQAVDDQKVDPDMEDTMEEVLIVTKALAAIASRRDGELGSSDADVASFLDMGHQGLALCSSVKQEAYYGALLAEQQRAAPVNRRLRPKMDKLVPKLKAYLELGEVTSGGAMLVEAMQVSSEAAAGLRPTQADEINELTNQASKSYEMAHLSAFKRNNVEAICLADLELYIKEAEKVYGLTDDRRALKAFMVQKQQSLGHVARFNALQAACKEWVKAQDGKTDLDIQSLNNIKLATIPLEGLTPEGQPVIESIKEAATLTIALLAPRGENDFEVGRLEAEVSEILALAEVAKLLNGLVRIGDSGKEAGITELVNHSSAIESCVAFYKLGDTPEARLSADKNYAGAREVKSGLLVIEEMFFGEGAGKVTGRTKSVAKHAKQLLKECGAGELDRLMTKCTEAIKGLTPLGADFNQKQWDDEFQGDDIHDLLELAKGSLLKTAPKTLEAAVSKAVTAHKNYKYALESFGGDLEHTDFEKAAKCQVEIARRALVAANCCAFIKEFSTQPLKLRRVLRAQKESLTADQWESMNAVLASDVETRLSHQRAKGST